MTAVGLRLSEAQAARILESFERDHRAYDYMVDGVPVWQLLRFAVGMRLQNLPLGSPKLGSPAYLATRWLRALLCLARLLIRGNRARYIVKTYASALRLFDGQGYRDIYFDALLSAQPGGIKFQFPNALGFRVRERRAYLAPALDSLAVQGSGALLGRFFPIRRDATEFSSLANLIRHGLAIEEFPAHRIRRMFSSFHWQMRIYELLLRRIRPRTVLVVDTGERALLAACRRQRVRFVELQHGVFNRHHPDALPGYAVGGNSGLLLPDILGVYGEYWRELLTGTALAEMDRTVAVGASVIDQYRALRKSAFVPDRRRPVITLTSQGLDTENLIRFLRQFLSLCDADLALTIKLHPAYDPSSAAYMDAFSSCPRVRVVAGGEDPNTYELIALSDLHLSIASACHFDALGIGVPTVVIGLVGHEIMADVVHRGDAIMVSAPEDLAQVVHRRAWGPVATQVSEKYFRANFVQNIAPLLD